MKKTTPKETGHHQKHRRRLVNRFRMAAMLDISEWTLRQYEKQGLVPGLRFGGVLRFDPDQVFAAIEELQERN